VDLARGAVFATAHIAFSLLIQLEIYALDIRRIEDGTLSALSFIVTFPFLQLEHFAVAALPATLAALCWSRPMLRWLPQLALLLLNGWLILDQVGFGMFFDHINFSMNDDSVRAVPAMLPSLWDSVFVELDGIFATNLVLCALLSLWVRRANPIPVPRLEVRKIPAWPIGAWAVLSLVMSLSVDNHALKHHAAVSLWRGALGASPPAEPPEISEAQLYRLAFGETRPEPEIDAALQRALGQLNQRKPGPNVLLVVLESVGSLQLFPAGRVSSDRTPVLAGLLENGIAFTSVYTTFPGTVRSLVPLHTGGPMITWGSVYSELDHEYTGPTLVRSLSERGYRTALFSTGDMDFENLDGFMARLGFDLIVDAGSRPKPWRVSHRLHSWGVTDDALRDDAIAWMSGVNAGGRPFLAEYITVATHHPYAVPSGESTHGDPKTRYLQSLRYSDAFLGRLLAGMKRSGLLEHTLILVTGDHGEAFGERHPGNLIHKNFLYEENIRSFLIILAPGVFQGAVVSERVASMGDLLPTLLRGIGEQVPRTSGQSLWPPEYTSRPVFFHKNAHPELWGLRDGQWKFVANRVGEKHFELYDLERDPREQHNQAGLHPERVQLYDRLCAKWFAVANDAFVERLRDYELPTARGLRTAELGSTGAKRLVVGTRNETGRFVRSSPLRTTDPPVAWTLWVPYPENKTIRYAWTSPSGETWSNLFSLSADWSRTRVSYPGPLPLAEGRWRISLWDRDELLISTHFEVSHSASPRRTG
jgi:arylsulfatase A-like enzyme